MVEEWKINSTFDFESDTANKIFMNISEINYEALNIHVARNSEMMQKEH
jgi:hypothetical protein